MRFRHHFLKWLPAFSLLALGLSSPLAHATNPVEVSSLVRKHAHQVTLFQAIWKKDASAKIFGGAARDFVYYLLRFKGDKIPEGPIDVREFLSADSDIDVISRDQNLEALAGEYGVRRVELIDADRIDAHTFLGRSEIDQGYLPTEKLVLGKDGISTPPQFGDGLGELLTNQITMHLPTRAVFDTTKFAKIGINHPMLLCLRFVRAKSRAHFELPDVGSIDDPIPEFVAQRIREVTADARYDDFIDKLHNDKFREWVTSTIEKSALGRVDGAYSVRLWNELGFVPVFALSSALPKRNDLERFRSYDVRQKDAQIRALGFDPEKVIHNPSHFGAEHLLHGSRDIQSAYHILLDGFLPSGVGAAVGEGIYAVDEPNVGIANTVASGTGALVEIWLTPKARIVDIRANTEGREFFKAFKEQLWTGNPDAEDGAAYDDFAARFGIDVLRYDYIDSYAYAIKNPARILKKISPAFASLWIDTVRQIRHTHQAPELARLLSQMGWKDRTFKEKLRAIEAVPEDVLPWKLANRVGASSAIQGMSLLSELYRELPETDAQFDWVKSTLEREMELVIKRWISDPTQYEEFLDWSIKFAARSQWEREQGTAAYQQKDAELLALLQKKLIRTFRHFKLRSTPLSVPAYAAHSYCKSQNIDGTELLICTILEEPAKAVATGFIGLFRSLFAALPMSVAAIPAGLLTHSAAGDPYGIYVASAFYALSTAVTVGWTYYDTYIGSGRVQKAVRDWKQAFADGWYRLRLAHSPEADGRVKEVIKELNSCNYTLKVDESDLDVEDAS